jgi:ketosteroid isomerase-like protein
MSTTENKKLMEKIYGGTASRDGTLFIQSLADDVSWCVTGQNKWSRTFKGKQAVLEDLQGYFQSLLVQRSRTVAHRFMADGDFVVVEARGDNLTKTGIRYDNEYCWCSADDGKIVEIRSTATGAGRAALRDFRHPGYGRPSRPSRSIRRIYLLNGDHHGCAENRN